MKLALIKNGIVENVIKGDESFKINMEAKGYKVITINNDSDSISPGFRYDTGKFIDERPKPEITQKTEAQIRREEARQRLEEVDFDKVTTIKGLKKVVKDILESL